MFKKIFCIILLIQLTLPVQATMVWDFDNLEDNFNVVVPEPTTSPALPDSTPTPDPTPTPTPPSSSSSWWGGWWIASPIKDNCPDWDYSSSYYDWECWTSPENIINPDKNDEITQSWSTNSPISESVETPVVPSQKVFIVDSKEDSKDPTCDMTYTEVVKQKKCSFSLRNIDFKDIEDSFAKQYIEKLWQAWIVNGYYWTNQFKPNNTISRSEYLKVVLKALCMDYENIDVSQLPFLDVDKNTWQAKAISKAFELDIIDKNNKNFRPNDPITRSEALKILFSLSWIIPQWITTTEFEDVNSNSWEVKYIQTAKNMCLIQWYEEREQLLFKPYQNMTRAEVSKVVSNMIGL